MPAYDYRCIGCDVVREIIHAMSDKNPIVCESCGTAMKRVFSVPFMSTKGGSIERAKLQDLKKAENEIRHDLRENHLVEKVNPMGGKNLYDVYKGVKESGDMVKDTMQKTIENNRNNTEKKSREWKREALKRTPQRAKEKKERRLEEQRLKKRIVV